MRQEVNDDKKREFIYSGKIDWSNRNKTKNTRHRNEITVKQSSRAWLHMSHENIPAYE